MKRSLVTLVAALAVLLAWPSYAGAPPAPDGVIEMADPSRPPAGYSGPRPIGSRDISMVDYPRESFIAGEEGKVTITVLVGVDGKVEDQKITTPSGSARLDDAAVQLVRQWHYVPAMRDGHPVPARFPVVINWNLQLVPWQVSFPSGRIEKGAFGRFHFAFMYAADGTIAIATPTFMRNHRSLFRLLRGTTVGKFLVAMDGTIANAIIEKSSGRSRFDDAAIKAMETNARFQPATSQDGQAVGVWVRASISWQLLSPMHPNYN